MAFSNVHDGHSTMKSIVEEELHYDNSFWSRMIFGFVFIFLSSGKLFWNSWIFDKLKNSEKSREFVKRRLLVRSIIDRLFINKLGIYQLRINENSELSYDKSCLGKFAGKIDILCQCTCDLVRLTNALFLLLIILLISSILYNGKEMIIGIICIKIFPSNFTLV